MNGTQIALTLISQCLNNYVPRFYKITPEGIDDLINSTEPRIWFIMSRRDIPDGKPFVIEQLQALGDDYTITFIIKTTDRDNEFYRVVYEIPSAYHDDFRAILDDPMWAIPYDKIVEMEEPLTRHININSARLVGSNKTTEVVGGTMVHNGFVELLKAIIRSGGSHATAATPPADDDITLLFANNLGMESIQDFTIARIWLTPTGNLLYFKIFGNPGVTPPYYVGFQLNDELRAKMIQAVQTGAQLTHNNVIELEETFLSRPIDPPVTFNGPGPRGEDHPSVVEEDMQLLMGEIAQKIFGDKPLLVNNLGMLKVEFNKSAEGIVMMSCDFYVESK